MKKYADRLRAYEAEKSQLLQMCKDDKELQALLIKLARKHRI